MRIRLLAFASAADALGSGEREVELPDGSTVADLQRRLGREHPALAPLWPRLAVAVDGEVASAETVLAEDSEVALLPPVSGGVMRAELVEGTIDEAGLLGRLRSPGCGATVLFTGTVRDRNRGRGVRKIVYHAYRPMALRVLERILEQLESETPGLTAALVHRLGEIPVGEASVAIAVAAPHRDAAYAASRRALERLKQEAPIWKLEHYADGTTSWREEEPLTRSAP